MTISAIGALPAIPGHEAESMTLLTRLAQQPRRGQAAIAAIRRIPNDSWTVESMTSLADAVVGDSRHFLPAERTGAEFKQAVEFGREARRAAAGGRQAADLQSLRGGSAPFRIEAVRAGMRFSLNQFTVQAGEEVEIEFVNPDTGRTTFSLQYPVRSKPWG